MLYPIQKFVKKIINYFDYEIISSDKIIDSEFGPVFNKCRDYTMTTKERMYALYKAVQYVINSKIPGDFVECGVWRGGSAMVIALTLLEMGITNRKIYLYDTFTGMPKPSKNDYWISNKAFALIEWQKKQNKIANDWCYASLSDVKKNMLSTNYPSKNLVFIAGKVEDTIPKFIPDKIALLRLDTDWYESTRHELQHLFPLLTANGVLLLDDYGVWAGARKAVDEYFTHKKILLNRIDHSGRIAIKT